jgi:hypothetical protein
MEDNKIDYPKKIAEMEGLIQLLKDLKTTKAELSQLYLNKGIQTTKDTIETSIDRAQFFEKHLQCELDIFSLDAEIETKEMILKNYKERSEKDQENMAVMAEKARKEVPDRIKIAKQLSEHPKMPHDLKLKLRGVVNVYQTRYRFGYKDDEEAAVFLTGLNQLIESAENWIK